MRAMTEVIVGIIVLGLIVVYGFVKFYNAGGGIWMNESRRQKAADVKQAVEAAIDDMDEESREQLLAGVQPIVERKHQEYKAAVRDRIQDLSAEARAEVLAVLHEEGALTEEDVRELEGGA